MIAYLIYLFILAVLGLHRCSSFSLVAVHGLLLLWSMGSRVHGFQ